MSVPIPFDYEGRPVRTVVIDGEPWWVAADVCAVLEISNPRQAVSYLDEDEVQRVPVITSDGSGRTLDTNIISESGLYSLILRSRKPLAKAFKRWITHEVIPEVRRTGSYSVQSAYEIPQTHAAALRMAAEQMERAEAAEARAIEQGKELESTRPKAAYVDAFINPAEDVTTLGVFAKELGIPAKDLRQYLTDHKLIYKRTLGRRWSASKQREDVEYQWLFYAGYEAWFSLRDQPDAPRLHNGQVRTTLYVTPVGKERIRRLMERKPLGGAA